MSMGFLPRYLSLALLLALGACSGEAPYVHNASAFNRKSPNYAKDREDIEEVTICYSKGNATPEEVRKLARDECAKFEKEVRLLKQDYSTCPMSAPVSAHFACYVPQPAYPTGNTANDAAKEYGDYGGTSVNAPALYHYPSVPGRVPMAPRQ